MDNGNLMTDKNYRKDLGNTLIQWVKAAKKKRYYRNNFSNDFLINGGPANTR